MGNNLDVLYEDEHYLFINKPAGISVHGDGKTEETTVADLVLASYPSLKDVGEPFVLEYKGETIEIPRPGIVHRLDKETSGVMVLAKDQETYEYLKIEFQKRNVEKIYHAFVYGWPKEDEMKVTHPIGRDLGSIRRWAVGRNVRGEAKEARTDIKVLKRFGSKLYEGKGSTEEGTYSFIEARPKTGRTHQIRVHMRSLNHPVVADSLYASKRDKALGFERLALHARSLSITLQTGEKKTVEAPYPQDFEGALAVA